MRGQGQRAKNEHRLAVQWLPTAWLTEIRQEGDSSAGTASRDLSCLVPETTFSLSKICRVGNRPAVRVSGLMRVNRQRIYRINGEPVHAF